MIIRKYTENDKNGLVQLWSKSFPNDPPHNEPSKMIEAKLEVDDQIFVAEDGGRIVGACMAGYDGHRGWLYSVAVMPEQRRQGNWLHQGQSSNSSVQSRSKSLLRVFRLRCRRAH